MNDDKVNNTLPPPGDDATQQCPHCDGNACHSRCNLHSFNWLADIPDSARYTDLVEVHFKNTRRNFYRNPLSLDLKPGELVAVETPTGGHDIGTVALTGPLVKLQMKRANLKPDVEILRIFRRAKATDLERFEAAKAREVDTMIRSRKIAADLDLKMKIGDVEYQGDGSKAIFYYIADERVDFRQLIKVLAETFKIRVEMKQIGARQEAGRIGGMGPCGRPLCCASWMTKFVSVSTGAARVQDVSLNPQKLAGQCAKLKCCINFEVDSYVEISKQMPPRDKVLETADATYFLFKTDTLKREMTYSTDKRIAANLVTLPIERVWQVIEMNKNGEKPEKLNGDTGKPVERSAYGDLVGQDSINRFDKKKKKKKKKGGGNDRQPQPAEAKQPRQENRRPQRNDRPHKGGPGPRPPKNNGKPRPQNNN